PKQLSRLFRGELDWIVMKALEKDRNRRYESASAFAADVQRYLNDEPVLACPPSVSYRVRKFVRRNKGPVLAASIIVGLLIVGILGTTTGWLWALDAEQEAVTQSNQKTEALRQAVAEAEEKEKAWKQVTLEAEEKEKARQKAAKERERTRQALNTMTDEMMDDLLGQQVRLTDRHREFLKRVLAFHEAFAADTADDTESP